MDMSNVVILLPYNDSCAGKVNGHELIEIGLQAERRLLVFKRVKHLIFVEKGTRNIWYKNTFCYPAVVAMGFKASELKLHPKAVPMEEYAKYFLDRIDPEWLKRNDYRLT